MVRRNNLTSELKQYLWRELLSSATDTLRHRIDVSSDSNVVVDDQRWDVKIAARKSILCESSTCDWVN